MTAIRSTNPLSSSAQASAQLQPTAAQQTNVPKPGTLIFSVIERYLVSVADDDRVDATNGTTTPSSYIIARYRVVKQEHQQIFNERWKKLAQEIQAFFKNHCKNAKDGYQDIAHGKERFMGFFKNKQPVYGIVTLESGDFDGYFHERLPHFLGRFSCGDIKVHGRFFQGEPNGYCMAVFGNTTYERGWVLVQGRDSVEASPNQMAFLLKQDSQSILQVMFAQVEKFEDGPVVVTSPGASFKGDLKNGEPEKGLLSLLDFNYSGEFANKAAHGDGSLDCPYASYSGSFKQWKAHGFGTHISINGHLYVGGWRDGMRCGKGSSYDPTGDEYTGEWRDNKKNGKGKLSLRDGRVFEGEWENDELNGQGQYQFPDGKKYNGQFKNGKRHGYGISINGKGDRYIGEWENDIQHGNGLMIYFNGIKYVGSWIQGVATGVGTCKYESGDTYEGGIENGLRNGTGTYTSVSGERYEGKWVKNLRHGQGKMVFRDGVFEGMWENDKQLPMGTFRYSNGDVYRGSWMDGMKQGIGTLIYTNSNFCTGTWVNDKMEGFGLFVRVEKEYIYTFKCMWKNTMYAGGEYEVVTTPRTGNIDADLDKATEGFPPK